MEWYRVSPHDPQRLVEFLTDSATLLRAPVTSDDLGRYRCVATSSQGRTRARDAVLSKIDDDNTRNVDLLIYGFVDRQTTDIYVDLDEAADLKQTFRTAAIANNKKAHRSNWDIIGKINGLQLQVRRLRPRVESRKLKLGKPAAFKYTIFPFDFIFDNEKLILDHKLPVFKVLE